MLSVVQPCQILSTTRAARSSLSPLLAWQRRSFCSSLPRYSTVKKVDLSSQKNDYIAVNVVNDASIRAIPSSDLEVYPDFLSSDEQRVLLSAALKKLDSMASRDERKRRREWNKANKGKVADSALKSECSTI